MSDSEEHSDVEESKPSEAELALKKRREAPKQISHGLDDAAKELLATNLKDRERMDDEITELRKRNAKRKQEREQLEKKLTAQRAAEDERRKAAEEEKRKKKEEEDQKRQQARAKKQAALEKTEEEKKRKKEEEDHKRLQARAQKQAEFEKLGTGKRNFVISASSPKKGDEDEEEEVGVVKKSKEQLDAEKKAILKQRIQPLEVGGFDKSKLAEKAKELHKAILKLEGEKYDLEKRYKVQQIDMMELAERARQANKVGKQGLKRVQQSEEIDRIQAHFSGAPAKIEMFSKYERQKDKRSYDERHKVHGGPQYLRPASRIKPTKIVKWGEEGLPHYEELAGAAAEGGGHAGEE